MFIESTTNHGFTSVNARPNKAIKAAVLTAFSRAYFLVLSLVFFLVLSLASSPSIAGSIDCSVVYDEYDSLMNGRFLIEPRDYVPGFAQWFTEPGYQRMQKSVFKLYPERGGAGVLVFRTNHNRHGRLLYHWTEPLADGRRFLMITDAAWYTRVADGAGLNLFGQLRVPAGAGADLDTVTLVDSDPPGAEELPKFTFVSADAEEGREFDPSALQVAETEEELAEFLAAIDEQQAPIEIGDGTLHDEEYVATLPSGPPESRPTADIRVEMEPLTGTYYLMAVNGAELFFPSGSLCREAGVETAPVGLPLPVSASTPGQPEPTGVPDR